MLYMHGVACVAQRACRVRMFYIARADKGVMRNKALRYDLAIERRGSGDRVLRLRRLSSHILCVRPSPSRFPSPLACTCFRFALMAAPGQDAAAAAAAAIAAAGGDPQIAHLQQARANLQLLKEQQKRVAKDVKNEERKRARNLERARGLSPADLLSVFTEKVNAEAKAQAKAKAKGKAKAKAKAVAAAAAPAAADADGDGAASRSSLQN